MADISLSKQGYMSADEWRERVAYDRDTGVLTWLKSYFKSRIGQPIGSIAPEGYVRAHIDGRLWVVHRLIWLHVHGVWPTGQIDHINGNRSDNRLCNLREATPSQNCANSRARRSGLKGATFVRKIGRWQAQIGIGRKNVFLGLFDTEEEAAAAYARKAREVHGEFARVA